MERNHRILRAPPTLKATSPYLSKILSHRPKKHHQVASLIVEHDDDVEMDIAGSNEPLVYNLPSEAPALIPAPLLSAVHIPCSYVIGAIESESEDDVES
jgi:hypothetical protein